MQGFRIRRPSPATVISVVALFVALGGTAVAAFGPFKGDKIIKKHSLSGNRLTDQAELARDGSERRPRCNGRLGKPSAAASLDPAHADQQLDTIRAVDHPSAGGGRRCAGRRSLPRCDDVRRHSTV